MEENIFTQKNEEEITHKDFWYVDKLMHQFRPDETAAPTVVEKTGEVLYPMTNAYDRPRLKARLIRTKPENGEEDLIIVIPEYRDTLTRDIIPQDAIFSRATALETDIQKLWPDYKADMTREQVFALPSVTVDEALCRLGIYIKKDENDKIVTDLEGKPIITRSVKWLSLMLGENTFELSGDKKAYVAPVKQEPEQEPEQAEEPAEDNEQGDE